MHKPKTEKRTSTPWHLWVVGGVSFLWNTGGVFDFMMTQTRNANYMAEFNEEQLAFFYGLPVWIVVVWGVAVWTSLTGSLLLLLRKAYAAPVFLVSFVSMFLSMFQNYVLSDGMKVMGTSAGMLAFTAAIVIVGVLLYVYARTMSRQNVLRA